MRYMMFCIYIPAAYMSALYDLLHVSVSTLSGLQWNTSM